MGDSFCDVMNIQDSKRGILYQSNEHIALEIRDFRCGQRYETALLNRSVVYLTLSKITQTIIWLSL